MDAAPTDHRTAGVPLGVVAREWGRIGLTGFGGPPVHIALLRALVVAASAGWRPPTSRRRSRPATCCPGRPRPSWPSTWRPGWAAGAAGARRRLVLRACPRSWRSPPLGAVLGQRAARVGARGWCRGRARRWRRSPCQAGSELLGPSRRRAAGDRARAACAGRCTPRRARSARRWPGPISCSCCSPAGCAELAVAAWRLRLAAVVVPLPGRRWPRGGLGVAGVGGVQGRRPLLRRRLRDRPADAERRGAHLPLAELDAVPQRRRARAGDAGAGRGHGGGDRLCRPRRGRGGARRADRLCALVRFRAARRRAL